MMPSSSIGSFALYGDSDLMDRRGIGDFRGETTELPAEKEQLRRNLSLLKKKIHSQAGSRRSQVKWRLSGHVKRRDLERKNGDSAFHCTLESIHSSADKYIIVWNRSQFAADVDVLILTQPFPAARVIKLHSPHLDVFLRMSLTQSECRSKGGRRI